MSENIDQKPEVSLEQLQQEIVKRDEALQGILGEVESLKAHNAKILDEKKKEQSKRRDAEEVARKESEQVARKNGDFEQLLKSSESEREQLQNKLQELDLGMKKEKINNKALELAQTAASGYRAHDLAEHLSKRLSIRDGEILATNNQGELTIDSPEKLLEEMKGMERFHHLFDGSQAKGGGAPGNSSSAGQPNVMKRADFNTLAPHKQHEFIVKSGGKLED